MSRTTIQRVSEPRGKQALSGLVMAGIAVVLLFAVIGVVSAGSFVASKMASSTPTTKRHHQASRSAAGSPELSRARAQATAIVQSARAASNTIISRATVRAQHQANGILSTARHKAAVLVASAASSANSSGSTTTGAASSATGATASGTTTFVPTPTPVPVPAQSTTGSTASGGLSAGSSTATGSATSSTPNLSGLPVSWKVVGYNATFGSGPGSAGSITITNRGDRTYAGTATVVYQGGGSASASFSGLAPGETEVLPLDGAAYGGGGYQIEMSVG